MRSGSSLVINALSVHSKIIILSDSLHFFRFIYKRYEPLNDKNVYRMLLHQKTRLHYRHGIEFDAEHIYLKIKERGYTYPVIYDELLEYFCGKTGKEICGDAPAMSWREIPVFLKMFPKGKVIHNYRDLRSVLASWKKLSSMPNNGYLNCIFNWIDSVNYVERFTNTLSKNSYFPLKHEAVVSDPEKWFRKLCEFLEVDFEDNLIKPERWRDFIGDSLVPIAKSSHEGGVVGFSSKRTARWKEVLEDWELCLVETLGGDILKRLGYELSDKKFSASVFSIALEKLKMNDFLLKNLCIYLAIGEGSKRYPNDPTDARYWAVSGSNKWWIDTPEAKQYLEAIKEIDKT